MSVMDKFLNSLKLNDEDLDDDYDDYDDEDEEVEEAPRRKVVARVEPDYEEERPRVKSTPKVTQMRQPRRTGDGMEVCVIKPTTV